LWLSSNDGAQAGDFVYAKELRWATIELIVQPASASVESGLDLFEALSGYVLCLRYIGWNTCINSVVASDEAVDLALFL
jgi:hypothetical protein